MIPAPSDLTRPIGLLVPELAGHLGVDATVELACDLLGGADPAAYQQEIVYLTGHRDPHDDWADHWPRVWGARALMYVWDDRATTAVIAGLADPAWRVAEMCLKVSSRRELPRAGDAAARLSGHELARVRAQAVRFLGLVGDTEHVGHVRRAQDDPDGNVRRAAVRALDLMAIRLDLVDP
ncbi:HEAT repeat domain-containing protein [Nocardioides sp. JQ2195]|uniref:HEAT repeat domain-containing protein n=1 Tax=Nocardioides sp. JQ2195 TaxID=2592334 RepID=UPI00143E1DD9|nr:HEAT repeat domain-containing protein [Nocardioides sp. JQ2195]QIX25895.1 HEAT repeat domain-containing protein [Nocardioides sp. JQ2195]